MKVNQDHSSAHWWPPT